MSAVGKAVGKATEFLTGGKNSPVQGDNYNPMSDQESQNLRSINDQIDAMFSDPATAKLAQSPEIQSLFANNLKSFLTKNGQNSPEDIQKASDFVDQTFTQPSQNQLNQQLTNLQSQYNANAAAMGRNPNADIASQQAFAGQATQAGLGLQAERGARIQQTVKDNYNQGLQSLGAGMQGTGFLNQLGQQAFNNRLQLINGRTGLADFYQKERSKATINSRQASSGLFNNLSALGSGAKNLYGSFSSLGGSMGGAGGGGGGASPAGGAGGFMQGGDFGLGGIG